MNIIKLTTEHRGGTKSTSFSGRHEGEEVRTQLRLDEYDKTDGEYYVSLPPDTTSLNPSFFLGLFYKSIKSLGLDSFEKKYQFMFSDLEPGLQDIIKQNYDECMRKAYNELNSSTGLG